MGLGVLYNLWRLLVNLKKFIFTPTNEQYCSTEFYAIVYSNQQHNTMSSVRHGCKDKLQGTKVMNKSVCLISSE